MHKDFRRIYNIIIIMSQKARITNVPLRLLIIRPTLFVAKPNICKTSVQNV